jgi:hypothetical protein
MSKPSITDPIIATGQIIVHPDGTVSPVNPNDQGTDGSVLASTHFGTAEAWALAREAYVQAKAADPDMAQFTASALVSVIFAVMTLEAFMSQALYMTRSFTSLHPKIDVFRTMMSELDKRETSGQLRLKYYMARWVIVGEPFDRGGAPYQDFNLLVDIRNALIHLKPDRTTADDQTKPDKIVMKLQEKHLIKDDPKERRYLWIHMISNAKVARWAINTAAEMIQGFWKDASEEQVRTFFWVHANAAHYQPID